MKALSEYTSNLNIKELRRKDHERRSLVTEFTDHLNVERRRDNAEKVARYMGVNQVGRREALEALSKEKDPNKKIWKVWTERAVHFKTFKLDTVELRDFLDACKAQEKDKRSFGRYFSTKLKVH